MLIPERIVVPGVVRCILSAVPGVRYSEVGSNGKKDVPAQNLVVLGCLDMQTYC